MNDLLDAERDRAHPKKRHRPIAAGALSPRTALAASLLFGAGGLALCASITPGLLGAGLVYLALTQFYSMVGKNIPILDILLIASGFVVRAVAGALAIDVPSSSWFLACILFAAIFLALCKRKAELNALEHGAADHRPVLASYTAPLLQALIASSLAATMMSYALYVFDVRARSGRDFHLVELTLPCVVYGLFRYVWLVETRGLGGSPEEVLLRDRGVQLAGLLFVVIAVLALYVA
jgi:4-hydroxybenzoate polyprenyltransferase